MKCSVPVLGPKNIKISPLGTFAYKLQRDLDLDQNVIFFNPDARAEVFDFSTTSVSRAMYNYDIRLITCEFVKRWKWVTKRKVAIASLLIAHSHLEALISSCRIEFVGIYWPIVQIFFD